MTFIKKHRVILGLVILLSFLFSPSMFVTDTTTGSVAEIHFFGVIPTGARFVYKAPDFKFSQSNWKVGVEEALEGQVKLGEYVLLSSPSGKAAFAFHSVRNSPDEATIEFFQQDGQSGILHSTNEIFTIGTNEVRWSLASQTSVYLYSDYLNSPRSNLSRFAFPVSRETADAFLKWQEPKTYWYSLPKETNGLKVAGQRQRQFGTNAK